MIKNMIIGFVGILIGLAGILAFGSGTPGSFGIAEVAAQPLPGARLFADAVEPGGRPADLASEAAPLSEARADAPQRLASGNPLWGLALETLSATRERPIFSQSRRPPMPPPPPEPIMDLAPQPEIAAPVEEPPPLTLVGTVVGATQSVALFLKTAERSIVRLRVGETESGWTLRSVEAKSTTLEKQNRQVSLALPAPGSALGPGAGQAAQMSEVFPNPNDAFLPPPGFEPNERF